MSKSYVRVSPQSGISDSQVLDIRRLFAAGFTKSDIADSFGVDRKTVYNIVNGNSWTHVPSPRQIGNFSNYEVYPDGRVWSRGSSRFVTSRTRKDGSVTVELRSGDRRQTVEVAMLVARAFVNSKVRTVNSISFRDGDSENTHFANLSVSTR